jgi:thiosulfate/3-mercaptopyruvate sulfurtransferase
MTGMRRRMTMGVAMVSMLVVVAGAGRPTSAQSAPGLTVTTAWVADHLKDPDLVILHVGPPAGYATAHVPGARLAASPAFSVTGQGADGSALNLQMPDEETLRKGLENLGISNNSRVVVYAPAPNGTPLATRLVLTLQYAGLGARTHLMQGGLTEWVAEGRPTTDVVPEPKPGTLSALKVVPLIVDGDTVEAQRKTAGVRVIDARARTLYDGVQTGGNQANPHKTGHIEGAVSVPFNSTYDAQGRFKSVDELRAIFTEAGVKPGETVIAYCHIGQQATATIFAARLLGYDVKLYDGSFEDWSKRPNAAVTNPAIKK